jgi:hypothetical protein
MLLDKNPENELIVFANAFAKYQRDNLFHRVLNKNIFVVLLLETIELLNNNNADISKKRFRYSFVGGMIVQKVYALKSKNS